MILFYFKAVDYYGHFEEQYVHFNSIYALNGTLIIVFPIKTIVITQRICLVDNYINGDVIAGKLKFTIFILGITIGIRNFLAIGL